MFSVEVTTVLSEIVDEEKFIWCHHGMILHCQKFMGSTWKPSIWFNWVL
jgi:hypothetical protein